jgi:hypothetical protein
LSTKDNKPLPALDRYGPSSTRAAGPSSREIVELSTKSQPILETFDPSSYVQS